MMYPQMPAFPQIYPQTQSNQLQFNPHGQNQEQFSVVPVSSEEEARNAIVNPLSTFLFVDYGTGKIYYKKMTQNGKSDFVVYAPALEAEPKEADGMAEVNRRLANIENMIGGMQNVQSVHSNAESRRVCEEPDRNLNTGNAESADVANAVAKSAVVPENARHDGWKR